MMIIKKFMHNTAVAASFAALLLVGACASSNDGLADRTDPSDEVVRVTQSGTVTPAPGPAIVDRDGNVYSSSSAGGAGNPSNVGTNTNVNIVPERSRVTVVESAALVTEPVVTERETVIVEREPVVERETIIVERQPVVTETTTRTETTTVPMTSAVQEETRTTTTTTRTRMRKD